MKLKIIFFLGYLSCISQTLIAQQFDFPEIGKPFPAVVFHNVHNYKKKTFSVTEQRGKWLIIDFWSLGCKSCFTGFKKIKEIETVHGNKVQFLLIGKKDHDFNVDIEAIYSRINSNMKLHVPVAYDSVLPAAWDIPFYPYLYMVDPNGVLRFITGGRDLSVSKITALLENQPVDFYPVSTLLDQKDFDVSSFTDNDKILTTTLISESDGEIYFGDIDLEMIDQLNPEDRTKGWKVSRVPLSMLYNYAYLGVRSWSRSDKMRYANVYPYPLLEMKDTSLFIFDDTVLPTKGAYNCFIKLPEGIGSSESYMHELQAGLKQTFGYTVSEEIREIAVWSLEAKPSAFKALRTIGETPYQTPGSAAGGFVLRNQSMHELVGMLTAHLLFDKRIMFVDGTGIDTNIDFRIQGDMTDFNVVQTEIARHGLSFVKRTKLIKVLVLKD